MQGESKSALVVGGGVIGQASAFRLAHSGWSVTLLDPTPGAGATNAAAGMVAPSAEVAPGEQDNYALQLEALPEWRRMNLELHDVTGRTVEIVDTGTLVVGWDVSDRRQATQYAQVAREFGVPAETVTRSTHGAMFEGVTGRIGEGLYISGDAWLDPDQAMGIIAEANDRLGVRMVAERVLEIGTTCKRVIAHTEQTTYSAALGVLATGAAVPPPGLATSGRNAIRPVRGMTARVRGLDRSAQPTLRAFVHGHLFYMVSRPGGYCVLGATSEERGDQVVEVGELQRLLRDALDVVPALESAVVLETRVGLRPASVDLRPFFEVLDGGRWAWSSGHYRHGVTLAPRAALEAVRFAEAMS